MIDSEQTITKKEVLSIAIRFLDSSFSPHEIYLSLQEMNTLDADGYLDSLVKGLKYFGLFGIYFRIIIFI